MGKLTVSRRTFGQETLALLLASAACAVSADGATAEGDQPREGSSTRDVIKQRLPGEPARDLILAEVTYPPGMGSPPHLHAKGVMAFVVSGSISSKVGDGPERVFHAGEAWWEPPGSLHRVSRNASSSETATLLAIFAAPEGAARDELYKPI